MPWFIWKGKNSYGDHRIWINKLPPIVKAQERTKEVKIPGRAGAVTLLEGEDVYEPVLKKCTITVTNDRDIQQILEWLRGESQVVFSNEPERVYFARIAAEVSFARISPDLQQAQVVFYCQPLKGKRYPQADTVAFGASGTMCNPGDVASRPKVTITATGTATVTIGEMTMYFTTAIDGVIVVDCEAQIITKNGALWTGTSVGDFFRIPKGTVNIAFTGASVVTIEPRWRWV